MPPRRKSAMEELAAAVPHSERARVQMETELQHVPLSLLHAEIQKRGANGGATTTNALVQSAGAEEEIAALRNQVNELKREVERLHLSGRAVVRDPDLARSANARLGGGAVFASQVLKPSLTQEVEHWVSTRAPKNALGTSSMADAHALHTKFHAAGGRLFNYATVDEFFAGLEGLIGSPSANFMLAMEREHASEERFEAWNANVKRATTPRAEWLYVKESRAGKAVPEPVGNGGESRGRQPSRATDATSGRAGWTLEDFAAQPEIQKAKLLLAEVAGMRLYSGPMYEKYNETLRNGVKGAFVTTLHAINSGIVKLSKLTKATTVYRGVSGGFLPAEFWQPNEHGVMGGVDLAFMSTSTERDVALGYMKQKGDTAQILFESMPLLVQPRA
eukprot:7389817-Prymnesium_polylepis.2